MCMGKTRFFFSLTRLLHYNFVKGLRKNIQFKTLQTGIYVVLYFHLFYLILFLSLMACLSLPEREKIENHTDS